MSRAFNGGTSADCITFAPGNAAPDQGPITIGFLAKASTTAGWTGWLGAGRKAGTRVWSALTSNNAGPKLFMENDFSNGVSGLSTSWRWYVVTKASGSAVPRWHIWDLAGAWSHADTDASVGDQTGPIDEILIGLDSAGTTWRGSIAVAATFTSALSDVSVEAAFTLAAADLLDATPGWMVRLNQASTATDVTDDTGGGGDQTALSGTTVDADDPPGFDYSLTPPPDLTATTSMGATQALTLAGSVSYAATSSMGATQALSLTGTAGYAATSSMGVTQALTLAGVLSFGATFPLTMDLTLAGTVEGGAAPETPPSWEGILGAVNDARAEHAKAQERRRRPIDCPEHLWPLEVRDGVYHCKFGGHVVRTR